MQILKDEFNINNERGTRIKISTLFKDWYFRKIQHQFPSATIDMIIVAKKVDKEEPSVNGKRSV